MLGYSDNKTEKNGRDEGRSNFEHYANARRRLTFSEVLYKTLYKTCSGTP